MSSRPDLNHPPVSEDVAAAMRERHKDVLEAVKAAVAAHDVVVVGMAWNQPVKKVRAALEAASVPYHYHEIGNYLGRWSERLTVKMWSGWPTFPQVYVRGVLVGGADLTRKALEDGSLQKRLGT
jgi:monothiol glutaredoxin